MLAGELIESGLHAAGYFMVDAPGAADPLFPDEHRQNVRNLTSLYINSVAVNSIFDGIDKKGSTMSQTTVLEVRVIKNLRSLMCSSWQFLNFQVNDGIKG